MYVCVCVYWLLCICQCNVGSGFTALQLSVLFHECVLHVCAYRYGGYLGLKYMLAARLDFAAQLVPAALPFLQKGLEVRAFARLNVVGVTF